MGTYTCRHGEHILEVARIMVNLATQQGVPVETTFNNVHLVVDPGDTPEEVVFSFFMQCDED